MSAVQDIDIYHLAETPASTPNSEKWLLTKGLLSAATALSLRAAKSVEDNIKDSDKSDVALNKESILSNRETIFGNFAHVRIAANFYIFSILKKLRAYLHRCHQCRLSSTPRKQPFGALQPILTPPHIFHKISIIFILALPRPSHDQFDCALSITEKLSKAIKIITGKSTWTVA